MMSDFVIFERRQFLQLVQADGEHVLEERFVRAEKQLSQQGFGRFLPIGADD